MALVMTISGSTIDNDVNIDGTHSQNDSLTGKRRKRNKNNGKRKSG